MQTEEGGGEDEVGVGGGEGKGKRERKVVGPEAVDVLEGGERKGGEGGSGRRLGRRFLSGISSLPRRFRV